MNLSKELHHLQTEHATRRHFLQGGMAGLGALMLGCSDLLGSKAKASTLQLPAIDPIRPFAQREPHFAAKAKRVIFLHMAGAPSQLELFDHKPELKKLDGKPCPQSLLDGERFAFIRGVPRMLASHYPFHQEKKTGKWVSDRLPHFEKHLDKVCFVHTMQTDQFNHAPAQLMLQTGTPRVGGASFGSWVTYGLGSENQDLPGYVVLVSGGKTPSAGTAAWSSGFLPSVYQGVQCRSLGDPVLFLSNPEGVDMAMRARMIEAINQVNESTHKEWGDPETLTRIAQYEMAGRMQLEATTAMNLHEETTETQELYGAEPGAESFANNCLLARRLVERGVRFVQLFDWGWDMHGTQAKESIDQGLITKCRQIDRPISALLTDLERRGLLEETLVVWGGEFGRTPMAENRGGDKNPFVGRDHHAKAFTVWMAGGGSKPGHSHGQTDSIGYFPTTDPVQVRDLHATMLHLLGFDHEELIFPFRGLDQKLTGVQKARVVNDLIA